MTIIKTAHGGILVAVLLVTQLPAQQPAAPAPALNPATARLDVTAGGLEGPGFAVAYLEESRLLVAASADGLACFPEDVAQGVRSGEGPQALASPHKGPVLAVVPVAGGFASGGADGKVRVWTGVSRVARTLDAGVVVRGLAAGPGGKSLAVAGDDGQVSVWDLSAEQPPTRLAGAADWQMAVAFAPDGKSLVAAGYDGRWRLWDLTAGKKLLEIEALPPLAAAPPPGTPPRSPNVVLALAFSPDGKTLALGGGDGQIHLFQTADGKFLRSLVGHTSAVTGLAFHPGGTLLVSASKDRTLRLWNPANPQPLKVLEGHTAWVEGVTFLAQGTRLASVGADSTVRLWDLTEPKK